MHLSLLSWVSTVSHVMYFKIIRKDLIQQCFLIKCTGLVKNIFLWRSLIYLFFYRLWKFFKYISMVVGMFIDVKGLAAWLLYRLSRSEGNLKVTSNKSIVEKSIPWKSIYLYIYLYIYLFIYILYMAYIKVWCWLRRRNTFSSNIKTTWLDLCYLI